MTSPVRISEEVRAARAVVAIETSVIGQGLPPPRNLECAERMSTAVRDAGAVPAWVGVVDGEVVVGLNPSELARFAVPGAAAKVARRDLAAAAAGGALGATTVSATVWAARRAGLAVAATGGIGGVHPSEGDVSADLIELARTPILLVCSGPKSVVDPEATAERLEELGVAVVGYRCDRLPFFLSREAAVELEHRVEDPAEAAAILRASRELAIASATLLCQPIPEEHAMDPAEVAVETRACLDELARLEVAGKDVTPFLLACLARRTGGRSIEANLGLLEANASLAGRVAAAAARRT